MRIRKYLPALALAMSGLTIMAGDLTLLATTGVQADFVFLVLFFTGFLFLGYGIALWPQPWTLEHNRFYALRNGHLYSDPEPERWPNGDGWTLYCIACAWEADDYGAYEEAMLTLAFNRLCSSKRSFVRQLAQNKALN